MKCLHPRLTAICVKLGHCPFGVFASGWCPGGGKPQWEPTPVIDPPRLVETVTPEGLRARAAIMRERGDESCARHLELAASRITFADFIIKRLERVLDNAGNLTAAAAVAVRTWNAGKRYDT